MRYRSRTGHGLGTRDSCARALWGRVFEPHYREDHPVPDRRPRYLYFWHQRIANIVDCGHARLPLAVNVLEGKVGRLMFWQSACFKWFAWRGISSVIIPRYPRWTGMRSVAEGRAIWQAVLCYRITPLRLSRSFRVPPVASDCTTGRAPRV